MVDPGAEPAVAEVGPVADVAVADADDVGEPVAGHVGEDGSTVQRRRGSASARALSDDIGTLIGAEAVLAQ